MEHKGKWKKRWIALGLSLMMILAGLSVEGLGTVTVYAEEEGGTVNSDESFGGICINAAGILNPWLEGEGSDSDKYFQITQTGADPKYKEVIPDQGTTPVDYDFYYDSSKKTLILNNMNVELGNGPIIESQYDGLTIELKGECSLKVASGNAIYLNGDTTVKSAGSGSLTATTTCGWVIDGEESLIPADKGAVGAYCPAAIVIDKGCERFVNDKNTTITAIAENAVSNGAPAFSADKLTCGNPNHSYADDAGEHKPSGTLVNYGTINGKIGLFEGCYDKLVSCKTKYDKPDDGHTYIGKAYYFTDEPIYPNNMIPDEALPEGEGRVVGEYNEDGTPKESKVWYQWIYKDAIGSVKTEDWEHPMQFLVYDDKPEEKLTPNDVAAVDDGKTHVFNNDLYAVWLTRGNVKVNGNVTLDVSCQAAPEEVWKTADEVRKLTGDNSYDGKGEMCYVRDEENKVQFYDSSESSVHVIGNVGCFSLNESYKGSAKVDGNINFCARYLDTTFLNQKENGKVKWIGRWQWQQDNSTNAPEEVYYCAVPKADQVVSNGAFTEKIKNLALAEAGTDVVLIGSGLYDGTYFMQTTATKDDESVAGTSAVVNDNSLLINVSKTNGLENNTYPIVRKIEEKAEKEIQSRLSNTSNMVAMDIAVIKQTKNENDEVTAQDKTEPTGTVNLYFDRIDLSKLNNPALFHIKGNGVMEKIALTTSGSDSASVSVKCQTSSFSTYIFAEDQAISQTPSSDSNTDNSGGGAPSGSTGGSPATETKPDGTKVETSTETKSDGTKVETSVETKPDGTRTENKVETKPDGTKVETSVETKSDGSKVETNAETKADGSKVENVVEIAKDGSVKTTETVTKADGSATKTEKETETNAKGKEVAVTTTTKTDVSGKVTGITQTSEIEKIAGTASATVTVEKTADGKITSAEAEVDKKGATSKKGVTATLSGSVVSQITEAADTKSVEISMTVTAGKKEYTVKADAQDLEAGNKLKVMAIDEKTGKHILVNAKTYTVSESGNVKLTLPEGMTYQLMDSKEAAAVEKQILATVKAKKTTATIAEGKKTTLKLSSKLDMDNVAKITYSSDKKSVATVSKTGKITGKNSGTVVITAKVTLKNGKTKNVKMKITVN